MLRRRRGASLTALAGLVLSAICVVAGAPAATAVDPDPHLWQGTRTGPQVLRQHADRLDSIAARNGIPRGSVRHVLQDPSTRVNGLGSITFAEPGPPDSRQGVAPEPGPFPYADTFKLHSRLGSARTIYLDFNGQTISGTQWAADDAGPYSALPYSLDGLASFTTVEQDAIQEIWQRVAEDYSPFDVDVTTQDPGAAAIDRTTAADTVYGTRMLVTNSPAADVTSSTTGVAFLGAFDRVGTGINGHDGLQPAWAFPAGLSFDTKRVSDVIIHELGHTLGLSHDGQTGGVDPVYYRGHGVWGPIMGAGYTRPVVQFSKGEYTNANNFEDDLAVIQSHGAVARPDDHTNVIASATPFTTSASGVITPATTPDGDMFKYTAPTSGNVTFTVTPAPAGPNLDVLLRVYSQSATVLGTNNPPATLVDERTATGLGASITLPVTAGVSYYPQVTSTGFLTGATGYTRYASLGQYTLTASAPGAAPHRLLENPGFENGSANPAPWTASAGVIDSSATEPSRSGTWKAWLNGRGTANTESVAQTVTIPSGVASATLRFWMHVSTAETDPSAFDTMKVQVLSTTGTVLKELAQYSNLNAAAGYQQKSFSLAAFAGQTVRLNLVGTEDATLRTSFVLDDFSLTAQMLKNPGFEKGSASPAPWVVSPGVVDSSATEPPRTGTWKAWLNGLGSANTESVAQTVTVPAGTPAATLRFWLHVSTAETGPSVFDTMKVQVMSTTGTVLQELAQYSNLNAAAGYQEKSFSLAAFAGQTVRLNLVGTEDSTLRTSFVLDDFSLTVE